MGTCDRDPSSGSITIDFWFSDVEKAAAVHRAVGATISTCSDELIPPATSSHVSAVSVPRERVPTTLWEYSRLSSSPPREVGIPALPALTGPPMLATPPRPQAQSGSESSPAERGSQDAHLIPRNFTDDLFQQTFGTPLSAFIADMPLTEFTKRASKYCVPLPYGVHNMLDNGRFYFAWNVDGNDIHLCIVRVNVPPNEIDSSFLDKPPFQRAYLRCSPADTNKWKFAFFVRKYLTLGCGIARPDVATLVAEFRGAASNCYPRSPICAPSASAHSGGAAAGAGAGCGGGP